MLNKVMLIGRLGRDPEVKYAQTGMAICTLNIATDESYVDRDGNKVDRTEWHRVVVFQRQAENCGKYLHKGSLIYVEGSLQTRKWQDPQGADRYTTEIRAQRVQFLDSKNATDIGNEAGNSSNYAPRQPKQADSAYDGGSYAAPRQQKQPIKQSPSANQALNERYSQRNQQPSEDLGPAFPSEANGFPNDANAMDNVPF